MAIQNNREIAVLQQAIQLQKKKLWTNWLNAEGLNPLAIGLRITRNLVGGGDRAAAKLELAKLQLRRAELETTLRQAVIQAILDYEKAEQNLTLAQAKLTVHLTHLKMAEVNYRFGVGSTEEMLQTWQLWDERQLQLQFAEAEVQQQLTRLCALLFPILVTK